MTGGAITNNSAQANGADGFDFSGASGASLAGGTVTGNTSLGNGDDGFEFGAPLTAGLVRDNTAASNGLVAAPTGDVTTNDGGGLAGEGFVFSDVSGADAAAIVIDSNTASGNFSRGFLINPATGPGTFTGNTASDNTGAGFEPAPLPAAIVTGGNAASGNAGGDGAP